ncbi:MAG: hypothetical protein HY508_14520 [Acidobacteria bacterium]|nr:hypothetical protein [Acidobacteriota bacterium]
MKKAMLLTFSRGDRPGILEELVSTFWAKGIHILTFETELSNGSVKVHLGVDKLALAREILCDHGWKPSPEHDGVVTYVDEQPVMQA